MTVSDWTVDYGDGPRPCQVPHCWRQDVDVRWEGPALYESTLDVVEPNSWLVFRGVSYRSEVSVNGELAADHCGIWDAFAVPLAPGRSTISVAVTKNGGESFPVPDVLSGFLPYVFNTFGGIFREVELVVSTQDPLAARPLPTPRIGVVGNKLRLDGRPWHMLGVLTWGWYPEVGSPHPPLDLLRAQLERVKSLGFNLVKFCLWLPPQSVFPLLEELGLWAWIELPLWLPSATMDLEAALEECGRIVLQYRHHDRIVAWTCGCELAESTPAEFRRRLFEMVKRQTGCPLAKDNSGGSEMYGGDLTEFGTFYDFHPYCDAPFYRPVLESLANGPRDPKPILLGEYNDYDLFRPKSHTDSSLRAICSDHRVTGTAGSGPYWASAEPALNDIGVRWQFDLATLSNIDEAGLVERSRTKARYVREKAFEAVWSIDDLAGSVVTGLDDTPISTAGVGDALFGADPRWFLVPFRSPAWKAGGNQAGWLDTQCFFAGENVVQIGARSCVAGRHSFEMRLDSQPIGEATLDLAEDVPRVVALARLNLRPGTHVFEVRGGSSRKEWVFRVIEPLDDLEFEEWRTSGKLRQLVGEHDGQKLTISPRRTDEPGLVFLGPADDATVSAPFWRECVQTSELDEDWPFWFSVSPDCVLDAKAFQDWTWVMTRTDTRTHSQAPYVAQKGGQVVTTLRPWGGLGSQAPTLRQNPAGHELLRWLMNLAATGLSSQT